MKLAIAHRNEVSPEWIWLSTDDLHPWEIRTKVRELIALNEDVCIVSMNITVIDACETYFRGIEDFTYENIFVLNSDKQLVPLASIKRPEWLAMFNLGDLFNRCHLDEWRTPGRNRTTAGPYET